MKPLLLLLFAIVLLNHMSIHAAGPASANVSDHWSFKPLKSPAVPTVTNNANWPRNPIDQFILARLEQQGLSLSPQAAPVDLLRRLHFVVTGLPPSPAEIESFLADPSQTAYEQRVDQLLASPAYGERWAQHWLDVVRYGDTDGFEVNTERRNSWPYRDYVIRAFNSDLPYNRFIQQQLAGDQFGEDAATGFLVSAAALLPGQIGADDVSKRLARADSLDEIIVNTGEAFLGLSIACARCHDHKFDPISQKDYYGLQAFFAGVEYGERPIQSAQATARLAQAEKLKAAATAIENSLHQYEPLARVGSAIRHTSAKHNEESFAPITARFVRFTIHDANRHPTLGLIEPCIDEFEIYAADGDTNNLALASAGTKATASGSRTSSNHKLEFVNDGKYGNSRSWMSDQAGQGTLLFELKEQKSISKIIWSRDREGMFTDRLPIAYTLEAGESLKSMTTIASIPVARPAVSAKLNTDRFAPITTTALRFTITAATTLEPCLDELEVFTSGTSPKNIALASTGTRASSSGTIPDSPIHRLEHINDGQYGNSHSWISNEPGRGTVELTFTQPHTIDRVLWARDREGKFNDRLPTQYKIEVKTANGEWLTVATSEDRRPYSADDKSAKTYSFAGLEKDQLAKAEALLRELQSLEKQIASLQQVPVAFAGIFRKPDITRLLNRGDPEQPLDEIAPTTLSHFSSIQLSSSTAEPERRKVLADWIASEQNPLTARVMVNRLWQGHFGTGLVDTPSDFGRTGGRPSHPELLDWLASEFIRSGWSVKKMHRLILTSATFQQSNRINPAARLVDADSRLLWRFPPRRLEAEVLRDTMLATSGRLNRKPGGPGWDLFSSRGGLSGFPPLETFPPEGLRRMIYAHKIRMEPDAVFTAFDCPDAGQTRPRRRQSTTPIQALNLFNSRFTLTESEAFAARIKAEIGPGGTAAQQVAHAWILSFGRKPSAAETQEAETLVHDHGLPALCRVIYNSNEFLFVP